MRSRHSTFWPASAARDRGRARRAAALICACLLLVSCQRAAPEKAAAPGDAKTDDVKTAKDGAGEGVTLAAEQVAKLGVETAPVAATEYTEEAAGFGVVLSHDTIAQAAAELATERAAAHLSRSSLALKRRASSRLPSSPAPPACSAACVALPGLISRTYSPSI